MFDESLYFKFRDRFNFSPHRFEIGNPIIQNRLLADNFFLLKLYNLRFDEYKAFYLFHLIYFLAKEPNQEKVFFDHVVDIVKNRINHYNRQNPISSDYASNMLLVRKLREFLETLKPLDEWHLLENNDNALAEKDREIERLNIRLKEMEEALQEAAIYDSIDKINIAKGYKGIFFNVLKQFLNLPVSDEIKLTKTQSLSPVYKMISKYCTYDGKDIPIDTARNYFKGDNKDEMPDSPNRISKNDIFEIVRKDDSKRTS